MYCPLIDRFRGAFVGSALAEERTASTQKGGAQFRLTPKLLQAGQGLSSLTACTTELWHGDRSDLATQTIVEAVLISLMLHESRLERLHAIQQGPNTLGTALLSEALALRLNSQPVMPQTLQLALPEFKNLDPGPLLATLASLISQRAPLQVATQAIAEFPEISVLDRAIALSLYCWLCTPQQLHISLGRSHRACQYFIEPEASLIPAVTGVLGGVSVGLARIPLALQQFKPDLAQALIPTANQLFQTWAGLNQDHPHPSGIQQSVIAQQGGLKPRTSSHCTLNHLDE